MSISLEKATDPLNPTMEGWADHLSLEPLILKYFDFVRNLMFILAQTYIKIWEYELKLILSVTIEILFTID